MGLLSKFSQKNKSSKHYQRNYEETKGKQDEDINVNITSNLDGVPEDILGNKGEYYTRVRESITRLDRKKIYRIGKTSSTKNDVFRKMEEESLPLEYLVAMGLVEEIDIEAYHNTKLKGITPSKEKSNEIDESIKKDILGYQEDLPELIVLMDEEEEEDPEEEEERLIEEENKKQLKELINKIKETKSKTVEGEKEEAKSKKEYSKNTNNLEERKEKKDKINSHNNKSKEDKRKVYVVYEGETLPKLSKYELVHVEDIGQVTSFTSTRKDVLVVTKKVPKVIQKSFLKWFKGLGNANRKYRIVTLKESEIKHELIEDVISLTDESLDNYFEKYKDEYYIGDDIGNFRDIGMFLEEGEDTNEG